VACKPQNIVIARAGTPDCDHNRGVDGHQSP